MNESKCPNCFDLLPRGVKHRSVKSGNGSRCVKDQRLIVNPELLKSPRKAVR